MNTTGKISAETSGSLFWPQILDADLRLFERPWNREAWEDTDFDQHKLYAWSEHEKLIGFALFRLIPGDNVAHLLKIFMQPTHRGRGETVLFWRELTFELKAQGAESVYLEVDSSNQRAIGFYQKVGFERLRPIKSFYSDGSDALTMQLTL